MCKNRQICFKTSRKSTKWSTKFPEIGTFLKSLMPESLIVRLKLFFISSFNFSDLVFPLAASSLFSFRLFKRQTAYEKQKLNNWNQLWKGWKKLKHLKILTRTLKLNNLKVHDKICFTRYFFQLRIFE